LTVPPDLEARVIAIVADALSHAPEDVKPYSSLMDDLGAESIDFIDIVFRLESDFDLLIPNEDLWAGSIDVRGDDPEAISRGVAQLKEAMPDFAWDRFPDGVKKQDLPRLITVGTIVSYLRKELEAKA
jgi:acyl carrier protein